MASSSSSSKGAHAPSVVELEQGEKVKVTSVKLKPSKEVRFRGDVVDNEGMGKRISKKCCIYHKKKKWNESDSDCDSDSDSDSDSECKHHHHH